MKNKKLMVCIIIFAFLVTVVILASTIFALQNVSVSFLSTTDKFTGKENLIIESGNFKYGNNILFLNKQNHIKQLEKNNPYLKVVNIETFFPNSVVINCAERVEVFAIKLEDNTYIYCDEDFKVLKKVNSFINTADNAILLEGLSNLSNVNEGDFLSFDLNKKALLQTTFKSFREWDLSYNNLKAKIKTVTIDYERLNQISVQMRSGVQIVIKDANQYNSDKFNLAFSTYDNNVNYQTEGIIEVRLVNDNQLQAYFQSSN